MSLRFATNLQFSSSCELTRIATTPLRQCPTALQQCRRDEHLHPSHTTTPNITTTITINSYNAHLLLLILPLALRPSTANHLHLPFCHDDDADDDHDEYYYFIIYLQHYCALCLYQYHDFHHDVNDDDFVGVY